MSDELAPVPRQTLFQINQQLADLLAVRSDMLATDPPEDISAIDAEIIKYFQQEATKADNIIPLWRHFQTVVETARAEAARLKAYADDVEAQLDHLKLRVKEVMIQFERKAIPGTVGRLMLKGNGGHAPIQINEELLPDELCKWEGTIYGTAWKHIPDHFKARADVKMKRLPSNTRIREALMEPCGHCGGADMGKECEYCNGTRRAGVPGARLLERGQHVEVK